jgi:hypothetical protein
MKSLTLFAGGKDKCVIRLQPEVFLGTNPMGELLKFEIGRSLKGPAILPSNISCSTLSYAIIGYCKADFIFAYI